MFRRLLISTILIPLTVLTLQGQCPVNDSLWSRLIFLQNSYSISTADQLSELVKYEGLINTCSFQYDSTRALLLQRIGAMYFRQTDYLKAIQYILRSVKVIADNSGKPSVDTKFLIVDYYSLAQVYGELGLIKEKIGALDSCEVLSERLHYVDELILYALLQKVKYYIGIGDYHRCISCADKCSRLAAAYYKSASDKKNEYVSACFVWKMNALIELKDFSTAEALLVEKTKEYRKPGYSENLGAVYALLALGEVQFGKYDEATRYFHEALEYDRKSGFIIGCKRILNNLAYTIYDKHFNDYDKSHIVYRKALSYVNKNPSLTREDAFENLNILANIANVFVKQNQYDSAFRYFQLSFNQIKQGIDEAGILKSSHEDFIQTEEMRYLMDLVINKGNAKSKQYNETGERTKIEEAIRIYKTADQLLERIKAEQSELESKLFWRSQTRRLYENAIDACFKIGNTVEGFYFFERSRAVLLAEELNDRKWLGENEILSLSQVKRKIFQKRKELSGLNASSAEYAAVQQDLNLNKQELDRLTDIIKSKNPVYYQGFLDTAFVDLAKVQKDLLHDHQALLEFYSGDSAVFSILITAAGCHIKKISKPAYEDLVNEYNRYISDAGLLNKAFPVFTNISRQLYQLVFQNESLPKGRIIVSPDGSSFPMEALITNSKKVDYFVMDHAVSYTYSARYLLYQFETSGYATSGDFVGIVPLRYPEYMHLQSLPGSNISVLKMKSFFSNANSLIGKDATKANFLQQFAKYKIVHLYTHAMDSSSTGEPVIWLADSTLYLSELVGEEKPRTSLIVLAACQTAAGKQYKGEGVFSFNRGFAALGIPSSVTNLWSVDNVSTYKISELFYRHLAQGEPIDISLQQAKIDFLSGSSRQDSLPFFWAAAILAGKSDAPKLRKPYSGMIWLTTVCLLGIVVALVWYRTRSRIA